MYGDARYLREAMQTAGRWYVLGVSSTTPVWLIRPALVMPLWLGIGRQPQRPHLAEDAPSWITVAAAIAAMPAHRWHRRSAQDGEKADCL